MVRPLLEDYDKLTKLVLTPEQARFVEEANVYRPHNRVIDGLLDMVDAAYDPPKPPSTDAELVAAMDAVLVPQSSANDVEVVMYAVRRALRERLK
jgi:hypothetical protein